MNLIRRLPIILILVVGFVSVRYSDEIKKWVKEKMPKLAEFVESKTEPKQ